MFILLSFNKINTFLSVFRRLAFCVIMMEVGMAFLLLPQIILAAAVSVGGRSSSGGSASDSSLGAGGATSTSPKQTGNNSSTTLTAMSTCHYDSEGVSRNQDTRWGDVIANSVRLPFSLRPIQAQYDYDLQFISFGEDGKPLAPYQIPRGRFQIISGIPSIILLDLLDADFSCVNCVVKMHWNQPADLTSEWTEVCAFATALYGPSIRVTNPADGNSTGVGRTLIDSDAMTAGGGHGGDSNATASSAACGLVEGDQAPMPGLIWILLSFLLGLGIFKFNRASS